MDKFGITPSLRVVTQVSLNMYIYIILILGIIMKTWCYAEFFFREELHEKAT